MEDRVRELAGEVTSVDGDAADTARERHLRLTKPPRSLGRLEDLGALLSGMAGQSSPPVPEQPAVVVAAGDHGVLAKGVSPWPQEVTAAMVANSCAGGAAVNAIAETVGARVNVLDVGVAGELPSHPRLRVKKVRPGTADLTEGPAMDREEAAKAVRAAGPTPWRVKRRLTERRDRCLWLRMTVVKI